MDANGYRPCRFCGQLCHHRTELPAHEKQCPEGHRLEDAVSDDLVDRLRWAKLERDRLAEMARGAARDVVAIEEELTRRGVNTKG